MLINGVNYHVETQGNGPRLMMLHGFTGSSANWSEIVGQLSSNYTLITPNILGHGETDSPDHSERYRMEQVAEDIVKIMGNDPLHLLGYSMGGRLALYIAIHYPQLVKSLILESSSPGLQTEEERATRRQSDDALAQRILDGGIKNFVNFWESISLFDSQNNLPDAIKARLRTQRLTNNPIGLANSLRGMGTGSQPSLWDSIASLQMPILLLAGELDTKFTQISYQMHALIPQSIVQIIPSAGHTIHNEQPETYAHVISDFLNSLPE